MISEADGRLLLGFARDIVHSRLNSKKPIVGPGLKRLNSRQGVFVTIHKDEDLRGCIGYVIGYFPLYQGIEKAAIAAAFEDSRFSPVSSEEWDRLKFEISVLTVPEDIQVTDGFTNIRPGQDGLIVELQERSGLLLPQVAEAQGWDSATFLSQTCLKAGLAPDAWKEKGVRIKRFQAQVFRE